MCDGRGRMMTGARSFFAFMEDSPRGILSTQQLHFFSVCQKPRPTPARPRHVIAHQSHANRGLVVNQQRSDPAPAFREIMESTLAWRRFWVSGQGYAFC